MTTRDHSTYPNGPTPDVADSEAPAAEGSGGRSALLGAMFLMATSAIGPGFITQTTTFTVELVWLLAVGLLAWLLTLWLGWESLSGLAELW